MTRIIGYLRRVSNFSEARQIEASRRYYADKDLVSLDIFDKVNDTEVDK